ncbi:Breast cancer type 2 susceptibility protein-like protein [Smittium culicis]|uniref:Breast cancer type 2 susceptibility protein-like protein n=1 Tax=Smittium culicis TaxID=133412 RepID=A0A1R1YSD5_9FUNG|nr:Breast cancer type 2 susceptibility protein-like protein [Smittium culicis]
MEHDNFSITRSADPHNSIEVSFAPKNHKLVHTNIIAEWLKLYKEKSPSAHIDMSNEDPQSSSAQQEESSSKTTIINPNANYSLNISLPLVPNPSPPIENPNLLLHAQDFDQILDKSKDQSPKLSNDKLKNISVNLNEEANLDSDKAIGDADLEIISSLEWDNTGYSSDITQKDWNSTADSNTPVAPLSSIPGLDLSVKSELSENIPVKNSFEINENSTELHTPEIINRLAIVKTKAEARFTKIIHKKDFKDSLLNSRTERTRTFSDFKTSDSLNSTWEIDDDNNKNSMLMSNDSVSSALFDNLKSQNTKLTPNAKKNLNNAFLSDDYLKSTPKFIYKSLNTNLKESSSPNNIKLLMDTPSSVHNSSRINYKPHCLSFNSNYSTNSPTQQTQPLIDSNPDLFSKLSDFNTTPHSNKRSLNFSLETPDLKNISTPDILYINNLSKNNNANSFTHSKYSDTNESPTKLPSSSNINNSNTTSNSKSKNLVFGSSSNFNNLQNDQPLELYSLDKHVLDKSDTNSIKSMCISIELPSSSSATPAKNKINNTTNNTNNTSDLILNHNSSLSNLPKDLEVFNAEKSNFTSKLSTNDLTLIDKSNEQGNNSVSHLELAPYDLKFQSSIPDLEFIKPIPTKIDESHNDLDSTFEVYNINNNLTSTSNILQKSPQSLINEDALPLNNPVPVPVILDSKDTNNSNIKTSIDIYAHENVENSPVIVDSHKEQQSNLDASQTEFAPPTIESTTLQPISKSQKTNMNEKIENKNIESNTNKLSFFDQILKQNNDFFQNNLEEDLQILVKKKDSLTDMHVSNNPVSGFSKATEITTPDPNKLGIGLELPPSSFFQGFTTASGANLGSLGDKVLDQDQLFEEILKKSRKTPQQEFKTPFKSNLVCKKTPLSNSNPTNINQRRVTSLAHSKINYTSQNPILNSNSRSNPSLQFPSPISNPDNSFMNYGNSELNQDDLFNAILKKPRSSTSLEFKTPFKKNQNIISKSCELQSSKITPLGKNGIPSFSGPNTNPIQSKSNFSLNPSSRPSKRPKNNLRKDFKTPFKLNLNGSNSGLKHKSASPGLINTPNLSAYSESSNNIFTPTNNRTHANIRSVSNNTNTSNVLSNRPKLPSPNQTSNTVLHSRYNKANIINTPIQSTQSINSINTSAAIPYRDEALKNIDIDEDYAQDLASYFDESDNFLSSSSSQSKSSASKDNPISNFHHANLDELSLEHDTNHQVCLNPSYNTPSKSSKIKSYINSNIPVGSSNSSNTEVSDKKLPDKNCISETGNQPFFSPSNSKSTSSLSENKDINDRTQIIEPNSTLIATSTTPTNLNITISTPSSLNSINYNKLSGVQSQGLRRQKHTRKPYTQIFQTPNIDSSRIQSTQKNQKSINVDATNDLSYNSQSNSNLSENSLVDTSMPNKRQRLYSTNKPGSIKSKTTLMEFKNLSCKFNNSKSISIPEYVRNMTFSSAKDFIFIENGIDNNAHTIVNRWGPEEAISELTGIIDITKSGLIKTDFDKWVHIQYQQLVFYLAVMSRCFPLSAIHFWGKNSVLQRLKNRYLKEFIESHRPSIRRILECDSSPKKLIVLFVASILPDGFVLLSDGWYSIRAKLDDVLSISLAKGRLKIGTKLILIGSTLVSGNSSHDGISPLQIDCPESETSPYLVIYANSVRTARWDQKLGFQSLNSRMSYSLNSIHPFGGPAYGEIDVIVCRRYPIRFIELKKGSSRIVRCAAEEARISSKYDERREKESQSILNNLNIHQAKSNMNSAKMPCISELDNMSGEQLYELYNSVTDQPNFFISLTPDQQKKIECYSETIKSEQSDSVREELLEKFPPRDVSQFFQILISDYNHSKIKKDRDSQYGRVFLSIWGADESTWSQFSEGKRFKVIFKPIPIDPELYKSVESIVKRRMFCISQISTNEVRKDIDIVGIVKECRSSTKYGKEMNQLTITQVSREHWNKYGIVDNSDHRSIIEPKQNTFMGEDSAIDSKADFGYQFEDHELEKLSNLYNLNGGENHSNSFLADGSVANTCENSVTLYASFPKAVYGNINFKVLKFTLSSNKFT